MAPATDRARPGGAREKGGEGGPWADAALLLVGHGDGRGGPRDSALAAHAAVLERRGLFGAVAAAFLKGAPGLAETLAALAAPRVYVVPFFMSDGYATRRLIPRALGLAPPGAPQAGGPAGGPASGPAIGPARAHGGGALLYCAPVGLALGLTDLISRRAAEACRRHGLSPGATSVLLVGHGTRRDKASGAAARGHAARLAAQGPFAAVAAAFLDEPPFVGEAAARLARPVVAVGLFAEAGRHGEEDVPRLLGLAAPRQAGDGPAGEARAGDGPAGEGPAGGGPAGGGLAGEGSAGGPQAEAAPGAPDMVYAGPIGPDPGMADLVLDRVRAFDGRHGSGGGGG